MLENEYHVIKAGKHELGYPLGEILFKGSYVEAEKYAKKIGSTEFTIKKYETSGAERVWPPVNGP